MHRSKGQWFLISAVIAIGAFLSISLVLKDFFVIDTSGPARDQGDSYLENLRNQFEAVVGQTSCTAMQKSVDGFIAFSRRQLWESGLYVHIEYDKTPPLEKTAPVGTYVYQCQDDDPGTVPIEPRIRNIDKGIMVAGDDSIFFYNMTTSQVNILIPGAV